MNGLNLVRAVLAVRPDQPCFLCTANDPDELSDDMAKAAGVKAVFRKPMDPEVFLAAMPKPGSFRRDDIAESIRGMVFAKEFTPTRFEPLAIGQ